MHYNAIYRTPGSQVPGIAESSTSVQALQTIPKVLENIEA